MKKHFLRTGVCLAMSALLLMGVACNGGGKSSDTTAEEKTALTEGSQASENTESETEEKTEMTTKEEETTGAERADGTFGSALLLNGFQADKNQPYITGKGCDVTFNEDGSLTVTGNWQNGERFSPLLQISYFSLMKSCLTGYTDKDDLVNGGETKYPVVVFAVKADAMIAGDTELSFVAGRKRDVSGSAAALTEAKGGSDTEYLIYDMSNTDFTSDYLYSLDLAWAWGTGEDNNIGASMTVYSVAFYENREDALQALRIEEPVTENRGNLPLNIEKGKLNSLIADIFSGNTVENETVMFLDRGDERQLLFRIDKVLSVTSYDGKKTYVEGKDYEVRDGKLVALEGGSIPCITSERYYNAGSDSLLMTEHDGEKKYTHWGEGQAMTNWQVNVTYTHSDQWNGFKQSCEAQVYADFLQKLQNGENVTVIFYGDSCTYGAASSFAYGYEPFQYSYALLVTQALADLYDYNVVFVRPKQSDTGPVPRAIRRDNPRGTITYINPSVGGWNSADGVKNYDTYLKPYIEKYGCDLFVMDLGGNDGSAEARSVRLNDETVIDRVLSDAKNPSIVIMSTMVPNPNAVNGWYTKEYMQEPQLVRAAEMYRKRGVSCAACCMTSMTLSVLDRVDFRDISGNNINHPNDFLARIYACTLFRTLVGYENLR